MSERIDTNAVLANAKAWIETVESGSPMDAIERRWMAFLGPCVPALEQESADAAMFRKNTAYREGLLLERIRRLEQLLRDFHFDDYGLPDSWPKAERIADALSDPAPTSLQPPPIDGQLAEFDDLRETP